MRPPTISIMMPLTAFITCGLVIAAPPATKPAAVDEATLPRESKITLKKLEFAVKDLTPQQRQKALPIVAEYGPLYDALEKKHRDEHEAILDNARKNGTGIDLKAEDVRISLRTRETSQLEAKYFDRIGAEALTPAQRIKWDAYRLHVTTAFHLAFMGLDQDKLKQLEPLTVQVATQLKPKPGEDSYKLFERRVREVEDRAAKTLMNDEQRQKYQDASTKSDELGRQMDELAAKEAAATQPAKAK